MTTALILSSDEERAWQIREALTAADVEIGQVFATSHTLLHRLAQSQDARPDLLVVDENSTPMNQWDLIRELGIRHPTAAVLAVVTDPQPEDYASALSNGARGVIRYPLSYEEIASLVETAVGWSSLLREAVRAPQTSAVRGGRIIAVAGAKGGTGASTAALHLALTAVREQPQENVVLIDLDLQKPDQSVLLDVPLSRELTDLLPVIEELTPRHLDDVLFAHAGGLRLLLGPRNGEQGELVTEFAARQIISMLATRSDLVVIDLGSIIGEAGATALEMADDILIVSTPDVLSLRGVHRLTELWDRLGIRAEGNTRVLLNRVNRRNDLSPDAARKIVRQPVLDAVLPDDPVSLEASVNRRDPALVSAAWTKDLQAVSQELGTIPPPTLSTPARGKRLSKKSKDTPKAEQIAAPALPAGGDAAPPESTAPAQASESASHALITGGSVPPPPPTAPPGTSASTADTGSSNGRALGPRRLSRARAERGAVSIETLAIVGLFAAIAAIAFQMVLVGVTAVFASHAANEGARAAAVGGDPVSAATRVTPDGWSDDMTVTSDSGRVRVELTSPSLVPSVEAFAFTIPASAGVVEEPR